MNLLTVKSQTNISLENNYKIIIFKNNKPMYKKKSINGIVKLKLEKGIYKLLIISQNSYPQKLCVPVIINQTKSTIKIVLNSPIKINIKLIDKNYDQLPIKKGEIILWQDHTQ